MDSKAPQSEASWDDEEFAKQVAEITDPHHKKYIEQGRAAFKLMVEMGNEKEGWKFQENKNECNIWHKRSAEGVLSTKSEGIIPFAPDTIL